MTGDEALPICPLFIKSHILTQILYFAASSSGPSNTALVISLLYPSFAISMSPRDLESC